MVSERSATLEGAYSGAIQQLPCFLATTLVRLNHVKGADIIRTDEIRADGL